MCAAGLISTAECSRKIGITDRSGLRDFMGGKYYGVELAEPLCDVVGDVMPFVKKN